MLNLNTNTFITAKQTLVKRGGIEYITALPARKIAIIATERSHSAYPNLSKILDNKKRFIAEIFYPNWSGEPKLVDLKKNVSEIIKFKPDWIVALGGGSVIDGAKIIWALYENPSYSDSDLYTSFSLPMLRKKSKFVAVPTNPGTGSETSSSAILTSNDGKNKIPIISHDFLPDLAILDADLLKNIPLKIVVPSMLDALSHSLEGYVSKMQNPLATNLSILATQNLILSLKKLVKNTEYQELALIGSFYGGIVQNVNLVGPAHALAHSIPVIPHGIATGLFLPNVISVYYKKNNFLQSKYDTLAKLIGYKNINELLEDIYKNVLISLKLSDKLSFYKKLNTNNFNDFAEYAMNDKLSRFFPDIFDKKDFINVLENSY